MNEPGACAKLVEIEGRTCHFSDGSAAFLPDHVTVGGLRQSGGWRLRRPDYGGGWDVRVGEPWMFLEIIFEDLVRVR